MTPTETRWLIQVPVATVWTSPDSPRDVDRHGTSPVSSMKEWLNHLTYETKLALCENNLVQSQVLYGEEVLVEDIQNGWARIVVPSQPSRKNSEGYPGYIPEKQLKEVRVSDWESDEGMAIVHTKQAVLLDMALDPIVELSYLTSLPVLHNEGDYVKVRIPGGKGLLPQEQVTCYPSIRDIPKGEGLELIQSGKAFLGLPYFWGGMSAFGYDCSGFAYNIHKAHGYLIPRDASDQAMAGNEVDLNALKPGDLLFFAYEEGKGRIHHVGFYYGDGKMLHAPSTGKGIEIIELEGTHYEKKLCKARRYWQNKEASA